MEFVILSLLALRAMTLYDLNKAFQQSVSLFYSASFGSITAALERLKAKGWVMVQAKVDNGRHKKVFHLTPAGQEALQTWLGSEIEAEKVKDPALTRLFFMGLVPHAQRVALVAQHVENLRQTHASLQALQEQSGRVAVPPELQEVYACQMLTLRYGLDFYQFNIGWYENLLATWQAQAEA